ncbi:MAG: helix-turn-helix transcriptional regulator [Lewinellaceae bacterium]|nr:helix-turn-helix transcriptional regulator [Lewinellaceae bacterium]
MTSRKAVLRPKEKKILSTLGENIKLARLRRKLSTEQVSERANISRSTLWSIEKGSPKVAMGKYVQVLSVLGLEKDLLSVGSDDILGRKLQDAELKTPKRAPKTETE